MDRGEGEGAWGAEVGTVKAAPRLELGVHDKVVIACQVPGVGALLPLAAADPEVLHATGEAAELFQLKQLLIKMLLHR